MRPATVLTLGILLLIVLLAGVVQIWLLTG